MSVLTTMIVLFVYVFTLRVCRSYVIVRVLCVGLFVSVGSRPCLGRSRSGTRVRDEGVGGKVFAFRLGPTGKGRRG